MVAALVAVSVALALVCATMLRVFRNVGPLSLEEHARREGIVYVPLARTLVDELASWSKPLRMRVSTDEHPLLGSLHLTFDLTDKERADV